MDKGHSLKLWLWATLPLGLLVLALVGCTLLRRGNDRPLLVTDGPLPDRDIVFQLSSSYNAGVDSPDKRIGFVNADGSGLTSIRITRGNVSPAVKPAWSPDGELLLFTNNSRGRLVGVL